MSASDDACADPWDAFRQRVVAAMAEVVAGDLSTFLVTQGPVVQIDPGPGLLGRKRKPRSVRAEVLALPLEEGFIFVRSVFCDPGAKDFPVDAHARRAMRSAGWQVPEDPGYFSLADHYFTAKVATGDHRRVADLAARTYPILGVTDPEQVEMKVEA